MVQCLSCIPTVCTTSSSSCLACLQSACLNLSGYSNSIHDTRVTNSTTELSRRQDNTDTTTTYTPSRTIAIISVTIFLVGAVLSLWFMYRNHQKKRAKGERMRSQFARIEEGLVRVNGGVPKHNGVFLDGEAVPLDPTRTWYHTSRKTNIGNTAGESWVGSRTDDYRFLQAGKERMPELERVPLAKPRARDREEVMVDNVDIV